MVENIPAVLAGKDAVPVVGGQIAFCRPFDSHEFRGVNPEGVVHDGEKWQENEIDQKDEQDHQNEVFGFSAKTPDTVHNAH